jgi:hypothetical protein
MSETVNKLVDAIRTGDALATEQAFSAAMAEKLSAKIDDYRQQVAAGMFNQVAESKYEDHEDDENDDKSDEEDKENKKD